MAAMTAPWWGRRRREAEETGRRCTSARCSRQVSKQASEGGQQDKGDARTRTMATRVRSRCFVGEEAEVGGCGVRLAPSRHSPQPPVPTAGGCRARASGHTHTCLVNVVGTAGEERRCSLRAQGQEAASGRASPKGGGGGGGEVRCGQQEAGTGSKSMPASWRDAAATASRHHMAPLECLRLASTRRPSAAPVAAAGGCAPGMLATTYLEWPEKPSCRPCRRGEAGDGPSAGWRCMIKDAARMWGERGRPEACAQRHTVQAFKMHRAPQESAETRASPHKPTSVVGACSF